MSKSPFRVSRHGRHHHPPEQQVAGQHLSRPLTVDPVATKTARTPVSAAVQHDSPRLTGRRRRAALTCALIASAAYAALALSVAAGLTQHWDEVARDYFRPGDRWGPAQMRVDLFVEGLKPWRVSVVLVAATAVATVLRRSWRPVTTVAAVTVPTAAVALLTKFLLARPDPHYEVSTLGGAFPSGHTLTILVAGGLLLRLCGPSRTWVRGGAWAVVGLVTAAMAISLLLEGAHWLSDILAGALLGVAALTAIADKSGGVSGRERPRRSRRRRLSGRPRSSG